MESHQNSIDEHLGTHRTKPGVIPTHCLSCFLLVFCVSGWTEPWKVTGEGL